jgi:hypothetical protein
VDAKTPLIELSLKQWPTPKARHTSQYLPYKEIDKKNVSTYYPTVI